MPDTIRRTVAAWDRSGWLRDGLRTFPVGLGVLAVWGTVLWLGQPDAIRPAATWLQAVGVASVVALAALGRRQARRVLVRRGARRADRELAATTTLQVYAGLAVLVTLAMLRADAYPYALAMGALAMTSPGVFLVVLDGSPPRRAAVRVLLAVLCVPAAVLAGYVAGFLAFWVSTIFGSFVVGFLAGHLTTFVPLALLGPGTAAATVVADG